MGEGHQAAGVAISEGRPAPRVAIAGATRDRALESDLGVRAVWSLAVRDELVGGSDPARAGAARARVAAVLQLIEDRRPVREVEDPVVVDALYRGSTALQAWRETIPSAAALWPLDDPAEGLVDGTELDPATHEIFVHSLDGRGIRSRGAAIEWVIDRLPEVRSLLSLTAGAAPSICRSLAARPGAGAVVLDPDPGALELVRRSARRWGVEDQLTTREANVLRLSSVQAALGGQGTADVVDCVGFFEYLPNDGRARHVDATSFARLAWSLVAPDGLLLLANMRSSHPELPFTLHAVRWPRIHPRSLGEVLEIVEAAGIGRSDVDLYLPDDGVHAVVAAHRPGTGARGPGRAVNGSAMEVRAWR